MSPFSSAPSVPGRLLQSDKTQDVRTCVCAHVCVCTPERVRLGNWLTQRGDWQAQHRQGGRQTQGRAAAGALSLARLGAEPPLPLGTPVSFLKPFDWTRPTRVRGGDLLHSEPPAFSVSPIWRHLHSRCPVAREG